MSSDFYLPDGRDFSSVFGSGNAGIDVQRYNSAGQNLGNIYRSGNIGINTYHICTDGTDCGSLFGKPLPTSPYLFYFYNATEDTPYSPEIDFGKQVTVSKIISEQMQGSNGIISCRIDGATYLTKPFQSWTSGTNDAGNYVRTFSTNIQCSKIALGFSVGVYSLIFARVTIYFS